MSIRKPQSTAKTFTKGAGTAIRNLDDPVEALGAFGMGVYYQGKGFVLNMYDYIEYICKTDPKTFYKCAGVGIVVVGTSMAVKKIKQHKDNKEPKE